MIFYECLYGRTPFLSEEGRNETKKNIIVSFILSFSKNTRLRRALTASLEPRNIV